MPTIGELNVKMTMNAASFNAGVKDTKRQIAGLSYDMDSFSLAPTEVYRALDRLNNQGGGSLKAVQTEMKASITSTRAMAVALEGLSPILHAAFGEFGNLVTALIGIGRFLKAASILLKSILVGSLVAAVAAVVLFRKEISNAVYRLGEMIGLTTNLTKEIKKLDEATARMGKEVEERTAAKKVGEDLADLEEQLKVEQGLIGRREQLIRQFEKAGHFAPERKADLSMALEDAKARNEAMEARRKEYLELRRNMEMLEKGLTAEDYIEDAANRTLAIRIREKKELIDFNKKADEELKRQTELNTRLSQELQIRFGLKKASEFILDPRQRRLVEFGEWADEQIKNAEAVQERMAKGFSIGTFAATEFRFAKQNQPFMVGQQSETVKTNQILETTQALIKRKADELIRSIEDTGAMP